MSQITSCPLRSFAGVLAYEQRGTKPPPTVPRTSKLFAGIILSVYIDYSGNRHFLFPVTTRIPRLYCSFFLQVDLNLDFLKMCFFCF